MYSFGLNIKNILLFKLSYLIFFSIFSSHLVYAYQLCEIKEECFYDEKFKKKISFKKKVKDSKNFDNFFNRRDLNLLEIFLASTNEKSNQSSIEIEAIEQTENNDKVITKGDVIIKRNGADLLTYYIEYDKSSNLYKSERNIKFINKNQICTSDYFEYNFSEKFNKFINTKYALNWDRTAYNFQIYFEQDTKNTDLNFTILGGVFKGLGKEF